MHASGIEKNNLQERTEKKDYRRYHGGVRVPLQITQALLLFLKERLCLTSKILGFYLPQKGRCWRGIGPAFP